MERFRWSTDPEVADLPPVELALILEERDERRQAGTSAVSATRDAVALMAAHAPQEANEFFWREVEPTFGDGHQFELEALVFCSQVLPRIDASELDATLTRLQKMQKERLAAHPAVSASVRAEIVAAMWARGDRARAAQWE